MADSMGKDAVSAQAGTSGYFSSTETNIDATLSEDAMLQMLEDGTRDVCNSRKTVPQKIAELVWERYKIRENKLTRLSVCDKEPDIALRELNLEAWKSIFEKIKQRSKEIKTLPNEMSAISKQFESLARLQKIRSEMALNEISALPDDKVICNTLSIDPNDLSERISRTEAENIAFATTTVSENTAFSTANVTTPISQKTKRTPVKRTQSASKIPRGSQSASKIPRMKREACLTPVRTPISTRSSSSKKRTRLLAKT